MSIKVEDYLNSFYLIKAFWNDGLISETKSLVINPFGQYTDILNKTLWYLNFKQKYRKALIDTPVMKCYSSCSVNSFCKKKILESKIKTKLELIIFSKKNIN